MGKKTKVCHIISAFHRHDTRIFWKQCRSLVISGYDVTLIANDNLPDEEKEGVSIKSTRFGNSGRLKRIIFSGKKLFEAAYGIDADVYQIHDPEMIPVGLKLIKKGKKVVFDSHEDFPNQLLEKEWIPKIFRHILSRMARIYYNRNLKKFAAVFTVTPHIAESLRQSAGNVSVVTNFPIIEATSQTDGIENYNSKITTLCYAGTVYSTSLQENILDAIENIDPLEYTMVGTIEKDYLTAISKHKAWGKVKFINRVSKQELLKIYNQASIGIVLFDYSPNVGYKKGTLGNNKLFEYMESALPVICTDFELWKEIIDKYKCGIYVNPHNVDEIRNAISFMSSNKEDAYRMGQNGRRAVMEEYNWQTQEKVYLGVIRNVLSHKTE